MAAKGQPKTGGRKPGTPNKTTGALKEMILQALSNAGGVDYLEAQAHESPGAFLTLIGKVLPTTLQSDPDQPLELSLTVNYRKPDAS